MSEKRLSARYSLFLANWNPVFLSEVTTILNKARGDLDLLSHVSPDMTMRLRMIQGALDVYLNKLQQLLPGANGPAEATPARPCLPPGSRLPPTPPSMSRSTSQDNRELGSTGTPACSDMSRLFADRVNDTDSVAPGLMSILGDGNSEDGAATLALSGWIYCAQTITLDFGVYFRGFIMLLRAVQSL